MRNAGWAFRTQMHRPRRASPAMRRTSRNDRPPVIGLPGDAAPFEGSGEEGLIMRALTRF